jgi:DNA-binding PadR family transcriptional regulator
MVRVGGGADGLGRAIVLGLVVERADSCYQLERRLKERFGSAGYSDGTARQAIKQLQRDGLLRICEPRGRLRSVGGRAAAIYEPTPAGLESFREWLRASLSFPAVREELHAKIALCSPADLPRMVEIVNEAIVVSMTRLEGLNFRARKRRGVLDSDDWAACMDMIVSGGDQAWWDSRLKWLHRVRAFLEEELQRLPSGHGQGATGRTR